jgi:integrase
MAYQQGSIYLRNEAWYLKYYITELKNGTPERVHKTKPLCLLDDKHYGIPKKKNGKIVKNKNGETVLLPSPAVKLVRDKFMQTINVGQTSTSPSQNMSIVDFWEQKYLPYCEEIVTLTGQPRKKPATMYGYKQIWRQHLKEHFGRLTLQEYKAYMGTQFLRSLTGTQGKNTLKHIKGLGSSIFKRALNEQRIEANPWNDVQMPDDAIDPESTKHYTLSEAEDLISALVDHVDCQLVLALSCFMGLRPGEIAALKWEDFDSESVHIRRSVVRGNVDTPKTQESIASLPLIDQVKIPLELWRASSKSEGWVFESQNKTPVDLHNLISRVIIPHVEGGRECVRCDKTPEPSNVEWKGLYAGRRGACTAVVEMTNGNYAVAQALLRHKTMTTTLNVYKKQITPEALRVGMKLFEQKEQPASRFERRFGLERRTPRLPSSVAKVTFQTLSQESPTSADRVPSGPARCWK